MARIRTFLHEFYALICKNKLIVVYVIVCSSLNRA